MEDMEDIQSCQSICKNVAASEGIGIVTGSGNEADKRHHYLGILEQENNQPVEINVGNNTRGFVMELWTELPNLLALSIESPTGQTIGPVSLRRGIGEYVFVFEQTRVIFNYRVLVETTGAQLAFFQFDRPGKRNLEDYTGNTGAGEWNLSYLASNGRVSDGKCLFYPCKSGIYGDGTGIPGRWSVQRTIMERKIALQSVREEVILEITESNRILLRRGSM